MTTRSPTCSARATTPRRGGRHGKRPSRWAPRSPTACASSPDSATKPRGRLGYRDHFALALATGELDDQRLVATLDEVDRATAAPFDEWKARLDTTLSERFGCDPADLRPWHLDDPFFQDPPISGAVDLDPLFENADVEALTVRSYDGIGLDTRPVLARSDLYRA